MTHRTVTLPIAALLVSWCVQARAAPDCSAPEIEADAGVSARFPDLAARVRAAFAQRADVDRCARVQLVTRDGGFSVEVTLADGRRAARSATHSEDIASTLEALLLVPEPLERGAASASPPAATKPPPELPAISPPPHASHRQETRAPDDAEPGDHAPHARLGSSARLGLDVSALSGVRIGDGQDAIGLGALALIDLWDWLVGVSGRGDRYQTFASPPGNPVLEFALVAGRRFSVGPRALDLSAGFATVVQGTATFERSSPATGDFSESSSSTLPRLLLGGRIHWGALSKLHAVSGLDAELGPGRRGPEVPGAPRLPRWTLGISFGVDAEAR
jgi:hypothetical protein